MGYLRSAAGALPKSQRVTVGEGEQRDAGLGIGGRFHEIEAIETALATTQDRLKVLRRFVRIAWFRPIARPARRLRGTIATRHGDVGFGGWGYLEVGGGEGKLIKNANKLKQLRPNGRPPHGNSLVAAGRGGEGGDSGKTTKFVSQVFFSSWGYRCDALHRNIFRRPRLKKCIR